jgi:hypothetical protein
MATYAQQSYLQRHRARPRLIDAPPAPQLGLVVVIPCHAEPDPLTTLESLEACSPPAVAVEVIVLVNAGTQSPPEVHAQNDATVQAFEAWQRQPRRYRYHLQRVDDLRPKHAGVGLARKIGFDEGVDRLEQAGQADGVLVGLDADCTVAPNYLVAIEAWFAAHPAQQAASLFFEHPLRGASHPPAVYRAITQYELYLRYYVQGLRYAGYPLAYHCVGSAMAVRSSAYQAQNGMNRRKAGEDYYFLHKYMLLGTLGELHGTTVYPSPRPSQRVPFGTGRAVHAWLAGSQAEWRVFDRRSFDELAQLWDQVEGYYQGEEVDLELDPAMQVFLAQQNLAAALPSMRQHARTAASFRQRFLVWFDGLKTLQFMHFAREHFYPDQPIGRQARDLYQRCWGEPPDGCDLPSLLMAYRRWERNSTL